MNQKPTTGYFQTFRPPPRLPGGITERFPVGSRSSKNAPPPGLPAGGCVPTSLNNAMRLPPSEVSLRTGIYPGKWTWGERGAHHQPGRLFPITSWAIALSRHLSHCPVL